MCNTETADATITKLIEDLKKEYQRSWDEDDKDRIIKRMAKLRASMNPVVTTED